MLVRPADLSDFLFVHRCVSELQERQFDQESQRIIFEQNLKNPLCIYLIAVSDESNVGFLSCHCQYLLHHGGLIAEIEEMYVLPSFRSQQIGNKLLEQLLVAVRQKNVLQVEVTSSLKREAAHRFYLNNGFCSTHKKFTLAL